jgi:hypothetical protein
MTQSLASNLCEACDSLPATVSEPCDDEARPYRLCAACQHRLVKRSLRPMEWYRLALHHCPHNFSLHDDFYLNDGTADQPKEELVDADLFPAPSLSDKTANLNDLWEFTITRHALNEAIYEAWKRHPQALVLDLLTHNYEAPKNAHWKSTILELVSNCLGAGAAELVRRAWLDYPECMHFGALAKASVACLPTEEGFSRCFAVFKQLPLKEQRSRMMYMYDFKNSQMLDWIEAHIQPPITDHWGALASQSGMTWQRVVKWLESGRPMSLVALDSLNSVARAAENGWWKMHAPIQGLPPKDEVEHRLRAYEATDAAPAIQYSIDCILKRFHLLGPQS